MRKLSTYLLCLLILLTPGCGMFTTAAAQEKREQIHAAFDEGLITEAERDRRIKELDESTSDFWVQLGVIGINAVLAAVGGPLIVRRMRGPPTQKNGLPEQMLEAAVKVAVEKALKQPTT